MDERKVGLIIRALRCRRGWRQTDPARRVSQSLISLIESGHLDRLAVHVLRRVLLALDAGVRVDVRWRGGEGGRLLDEDHGQLVGLIADELTADGWIGEDRDHLSGIRGARLIRRDCVASGQANRRAPQKGVEFTYQLREW